jgi:hypothetical protein
MMSTTGDSFTWQVKIAFNASQTSAVRVDYTGVGKSLFLTGHGTMPVTPIVDNTNGYVMHGGSLIGADVAPAGSGSLFWIDFQIIAAPAPRETLTSQFAVKDPHAGPAADVNGDGVVNLFDTALTAKDFWKK